MKRKLVAAALALFMLTGCTKNAETIKEQPSINEEAVTATPMSTLKGDYDQTDLEESWNTENPQLITLSQNSIESAVNGVNVLGTVATITKGGEYVVRGSVDSGQIVIDATNNDIVHLVLDGAAISCADGPAIYVKQADRVVITLAQGSLNTLSDQGEYTLAEGADEPDATLFSHDDLTINGSGKLSITSKLNKGIKSKDDLRLINGEIDITTKAHAIVGRDSVLIKGGTYNIVSGEDGIKTTNDTDTQKGNIIIDGGVINLSATDDGIHSDQVITINDGSINITSSYEGLESKQINIHGGDVRVVSTDDGINAATSTATTDETGEVKEPSQAGTPPSEGSTPPSEGGTPPSEGSTPPTDTTNMARGGGGKMGKSDGSSMYITGGTVYVSAGGDGIDTNGTGHISGGTVIVNAANGTGDSALDYDGTFDISGGIFVATGSANMAVMTSDTSTQNSVMVNLDTVQSAGTTFGLISESGQCVAAYLAGADYQSILLSTPEIKQGLYAGHTGGTAQGESVNGFYKTSEYSGGVKAIDITVSTVNTQVGQGGGMGGNRTGGKGQRPGTADNTTAVK